VSPLTHRAACDILPPPASQHVAYSSDAEMLDTPNKHGLCLDVSPLYGTVWSHLCPPVALFLSAMTDPGSGSALLIV